MAKTISLVAAAVLFLGGLGVSQVAGAGVTDDDPVGAKACPREFVELRSTPVLTGRVAFGHECGGNGVQVDADIDVPTIPALPGDPVNCQQPDGACHVSYSITQKNKTVLETVGAPPVFPEATITVPDAYLVRCERPVEVTGSSFTLLVPYVTIGEEENCPQDAEYVNTIERLKETDRVNHADLLNPSVASASTVARLPSTFVTVYESQCTVNAIATSFQMGLSHSRTSFTCASATIGI